MCPFAGVGCSFKVNDDMPNLTKVPATFPPPSLPLQTLPKHHATPLGSSTLMSYQATNPTIKSLWYCGKFFLKPHLNTCSITQMCVAHTPLHGPELSFCSRAGQDGHSGDWDTLTVWEYLSTVFLHMAPRPALPHTDSHFPFAGMMVLVLLGGLCCHDSLTVPRVSSHLTAD